MNDKVLEEIINDIRELRDADFHVCPYDAWQEAGEPETTENTECSCEKFDLVIDKLRSLVSKDSIEHMG